MRKRYYTLYVMTNDASKSAQLKIPAGLLKAVGVVAAVCLLAAGVIIFDYMRLKASDSELYALKKENTSQKIALQGLTGKIKEIEAEISKLNVFDRKLRIIANIEEPKGPKTAAQINGMGGGETPEDADGGALSAKKNELVKSLDADLKGLEQRARSQESSFTELQETLLKRTSLLVSTPSIWPARGWVTSVYGERISPFTGLSQMHKGLDIANRPGTPVIAPADGVVVKVGVDPYLGKLVTISHGYGFKTTYGHLSETFVRVGQKIKRGTKIAAIGDTGRSTGAHLHYEVSMNGVAVNPDRYILN
ncbi:MAG: M23 family metallopeptidase [Deltaproteobacteria bacterium]|nr:M23 family metallopeptidase [Deltaproteobacteria bacterium]